MAYPNPYDPFARTDLTANEHALLTFMDKCMHGGDLSLIDTMVAPDYIQHTPGIGHGREGLRAYITQIAHKRPGWREWRAIQLFASGDVVTLHKLLPQVVIADFMRFNADGLMAENIGTWSSRCRNPATDPMKPSEENLDRFRALFGISQ
ncbi:nuclear transport factor 2 family protein [Breoghania sp.]|uniref:nuclear transport factor 2 family protein n=1 Tax=Breoghania sp. TaxID=2065378 RepID=UPI002636B1FA|nr:nuclear transport factor 2 family protein [Breoghania sp.]MDJ0931489.1 nuclear transport factor 2 family protein [Breoghania sp.]